MNLGRLTPDELYLWEVIYAKAIEIKAKEVFAHGTRISGTNSLEVANWAVTCFINLDAARTADWGVYCDRADKEEAANKLKH